MEKEEAKLRMCGAKTVWMKGQRGRSLTRRRKVEDWLEEDENAGIYAVWKKEQIGWLLEERADKDRG